ncbi:hypothetical protein LTS18_013345, partial [Coniosporium uncinatum]
ARQSDNFDSSLFSVDDIFPRLTAFRNRLASLGRANQPLYFVHVDVRSCFDTIPQDHLLPLIANILSSADYRIGRHAEFRPAEGHGSDINAGLKLKPRARFRACGRAGGDFASLGDVTKELAAGKNQTVFVEGLAQEVQQQRAVLSLLKEHVEMTVVKIGKKFYRQKNGIPQGSVLSTLLCSFFYANMEERCLGYTKAEDTLLLRLIDDFLLITADRAKAERFLRQMHAGLPAYGVEVKKDKTQTNFDVAINGNFVKGCVFDGVFPYCGVLLDTRSLEICKHPAQKSRTDVRNALTVDMGKMPGRNFHRKTLKYVFDPSRSVSGQTVRKSAYMHAPRSALKLHLHAMFLDTAFNSLHTVLSNIYHSFHDCATKAYHYIRALPSARQPPAKLLTSKSIPTLLSSHTSVLRSDIDPVTSQEPDMRRYVCSALKRTNHRNLQYTLPQAGVHAGAPRYLSSAQHRLRPSAT